MSSNDNAPILTVTDLAARWRCTRKSVLARIHAGDLHAFRIGMRAFRISLAEVQRYEEGRAA